MSAIQSTQVTTQDVAATETQNVTAATQETTTETHNDAQNTEQDMTQLSSYKKLTIEDCVKTIEYSSDACPRRVKLITMDNVLFIVPADWVKMSEYIASCIEDDEDLPEDECEPVIISEIHDHELIVDFIRYCEYHHNNRAKKIKKPVALSLEEVICEWDQQFLKLVDDVVTMDNRHLFNLSLTANYLGCNDLVNLCCAAMAYSIRGMKVEEMREYFDIENDLTPEEEEMIRKENAWIEGDSK